MAGLTREEAVHVISNAAKKEGIVMRGERTTVAASPVGAAHVVELIGEKDDVEFTFKAFFPMYPCPGRLNSHEDWGLYGNLCHVDFIAKMPDLDNKPEILKVGPVTLSFRPQRQSYTMMSSARSTGWRGKSQHYLEKWIHSFMEDVQHGVLSSTIGHALSNGSLDESDPDAELT